MDIQQIKNYILDNSLSEAFAEESLLTFVREQLHDFGRLMAFYRCAMMEVETKFNVISEDFTYQYERNPIENIKSRLKEPSSIRSKLERRGHPMTVESIEENLFDVAGVRVVCSFVDDVYQIAEALLRQDDVTLIERKDYIQNPKPNGYRSLHLIIAVPIFLTNQKKDDERGNPTAYHRHGLLGKSGTSAALQKREYHHSGYGNGSQNLR